MPPMSELPPTSSLESAASREPYLVIKDLTAGYGGPPIIEGGTLEARAASITAIVGPNGAGKSTLMKTIAGVIRPSSGEVHVCGQLATGLTADKLVRRGMAYVPQVANVFPSLTVYENLEMGAYTSKSGVRARIEELYELFPDLRPAAGQDTERRAAEHAGDGPRPHVPPQGPPGRRAHGRHGAEVRDGGVGAHRPGPADRSRSGRRRAEHPPHP